MRVLGIETSCDETGAGIVADGRYVLANVVASQIKVHAPYGGVVPELAAREHDVNLVPVVERAVAEGGGWEKIDALAVTVGPGLQGALLVGMMFAKALAHVKGLPLYAVNHLEAHLAAMMLDPVVVPPCVALLVTGGHTALFLIREWGDYLLLGETKDDAAGEAFDKVAKVLGLPYPGGPPLERLAREGDRKAFRFPRPMLRKGYDFSYAGLKTAVALTVKELGAAVACRRADVAASFQEAALGVLAAKLARAARAFNLPAAVVGGVAANARLREMLAAEGIAFNAPPVNLCGDNGALTAAAGFLAAARGELLAPTSDPVPALGLGRPFN